MKKTLIALAAFAAVGSSFAQEAVQVFGVADVSYSGGNATAANWRGLMSGQWSGSRLGFRGREDMGGGLFAGYWLEAGIDVDTHDAGGRGAQGHGAVLTQIEVDRRLQIEQRAGKPHRYAQIADGRDHNHTGYTTWFAGAGVKPGFSFGETDEFGYESVIDPVHIHDWHATILHLLGLEHTKLTYRYAGRDMRLTEVKGNVVKGILA